MIGIIEQGKADSQKQNGALEEMKNGNIQALFMNATLAPNTDQTLS